MGEIFHFDNPFFRGLGKLVDAAALSLLWLALCLPAAATGYFAGLAGGLFSLQNADGETVVLFADPGLLGGLLLWIPFWLTLILAGPASTALYYTAHKVLRHGRGYLWREFWHAFGSNFRQAAVLALLCGGILLFLGFDISVMYSYAETGGTAGLIYPVFAVFIAAVVMWAQYLFPYLARFENTTGQTAKNTVLIAVANLPQTAMMFLLLAACCVCVWFVPPLIFVMPAAYAVSQSMVIEKIFRKYMSGEDLAAEEERDQEFYN